MSTSNDPICHMYRHRAKNKPMAVPVDSRSDLELIIQLRRRRSEKEMRRWFHRLRRTPIALGYFRTWMSLSFDRLAFRMTRRIDLP